MQKKQKIKAVEEIGNLLCMNAKFGRVISEKLSELPGLTNHSF